jgi:hypothetical protein
MMPLALALAIPLTAIAALHAYWGIGGVWPGTDRASCARAVVGFNNLMPSPAACFAVAIVILVTLLVALALGGWFATPLDRIRLSGMALLIGLGFLARGVAGYTPWWRRLTPEQPFARLDTRFYSPLCLALGAGFVALSFGGFAS